MLLNNLDNIITLAVSLCIKDRPVEIFFHKYIYILFFQLTAEQKFILYLKMSNYM